MSNGVSSLQYGQVKYSGGPQAGIDEAVLLNADGYSRWFNYTEFNGNTKPLFEYTPGAMSNNPAPTASINPYRNFADGLPESYDYYEWIANSAFAKDRGIFRAGATNSRRYELQFPMPGGNPLLRFQYAVMATWSPGDSTLTGDPSVWDPGDFPEDANIDEPFFVATSTVASTLYNDGVGKNGGNFTADIEVFDWQGGSTGGNGVVNEIELMTVEGDFIPGGMVMLSQSELGTAASPGTVNSSVFQVEIADCSPVTSGVNEFWVVVESAGVNSDSYDQGMGTEFPSGATRAAFYRGAVFVDDKVPAEANTPPEINIIEDDLVGPGFYKDPVTVDDPPTTYNCIYTDPDVGQTHTVTWWIIQDGLPPTPADIVSMPVDWSTWVLGDYDIWVEVDDGFDATLGGPFDITLDPSPDGTWSDPVNIGGQARMPRAVQNESGELVLVYHKEDEGIWFSYNAGSQWEPAALAYTCDPEPNPGYLAIQSGNSDHLVYVSYRGRGGDENSDSNDDRQALRWNGPTGSWDYTYLWGATEQFTLLLPDDDGSFTEAYCWTTPGDFGSSLRLANRAFWGETNHDPGLLPVLEGFSIHTSNNACAVRNATHHGVAYRVWQDSKDWARFIRISKTDILTHDEFTIYQGQFGEIVDSVALCIDGSGVLHAAWRVVDSNSDQRIDYSRSTDGGAIWSAPVTAYQGEENYHTVLENYVGIVTDSQNRIFITYSQNPYLWMVKSSDGVDWSEPQSPYTAQLPLGWHWTQPYPVMTDDDILHLFFITKNEQWQFGAIIEVTWWD